MDLEAAVGQLQSWSASASELSGDHQYALLAADRAAAAAVIATHVDLFEFGGVEPGRSVILDAGCGHGESSLAMAALGALEVVAIDLLDPEIAAVRAAADLTGAPVRAVQASVFELPLPSGSIDVVVSVEGIGVYAELDRFLDEVARVLKPGGIVVMAEINDVLNPVLRRRARKLWRAYELGPAGEHHGHRIEVPYRDRRLAIARDRLPGVSEAQLSAIADNTFRFDGAAVAEACERFAQTGEMPAAPFDPERAPIDLDGMTVEAPVQPRWMRDALKQRGLQPRIAGSWGVSTPLKRVLTKVLRAFGPLVRWSAPSIRYRGRA